MKPSYLLLAPCVLLMPQPAPSQEAPADQLPNVIIFFADDMGIGDVGCYGCDDIATPNIDRLAARGTRFTNFYSAAPLCSPSRAGLLTGRYPIRAGVPTNCSSAPNTPGMPSEELTIAELLRTQGYTTGLVGKWHLGTSEDTVPNAQGFDEFFGFLGGCIDYRTHVFYYAEPHHHDLWRNREEIHEDGVDMTALITRDAAGFIQDHAGGPFFLYVPYNAPHYPMQAPERYYEPYDDMTEPRRSYAALVAALDDSIGRIVATIDELGIRENTLIFFLSDNGYSVEERCGGGGGSAGPHRGHKFSLFEGGIRQPLIVSWPAAVPEDQSRDQLAIALDLLPTIADASGTTLPEDRTIDGRSLLPILLEDAPSQHDTLFWQQGDQRAVRRGDWKLVLNPRESLPDTADLPTVFLSNLAEDPGERNNLADQHPEIVQELSNVLEAWSDGL